MGQNEQRMKNWKKHITPYVDILLFVMALLVANFFWKFTVMGD